MKWGALVALCLVLLATAAPALAQPSRARNLEAASTEQLIEVTSDFRGASITIFGAAPDRRPGGDFVVTLRGPAETVVVRRKRRILGLWINVDPVRFSEAPGYFALFANRPLDDIASPSQVWNLGLDPAALAILADQTPRDADAALYRQALVRLMRRKGLYINQLQNLNQSEGGLFIARVDLPANAPTGGYVWEAHYFRRGRLIGSSSGEVKVSEAGLERLLSTLADENPRLYGLAAVLLAGGAGWLVGLFSRRS